MNKVCDFFNKWMSQFLAQFCNYGTLQRRTRFRCATDFHCATPFRHLRIKRLKTQTLKIIKNKLPYGLCIINDVIRLWFWIIKMLNAGNAI